MTPPHDLAELLSAGEHAAFHARPADAVPVLERAVLLAREQDRQGELAAAAWLLGVALVACGRYGGALTVVQPLVDAGGAPGAPPERRLFGALAGATLGAAHRQLGRHAEARAADLAALALADDHPEARFDALVGLAGDAIGLDRAQEATAYLVRAVELVPGEAAPAEPGGRESWWRQRVRLSRTGAELAVLEGRPAEAVALARACVEAAERARAPRHAAKALLVLGIAQVSAHDPAAVHALLEAATRAEAVGALPVVWPSRALLGALLAGSDAQQSRACLAGARAVVLQMAADLPEALRAAWLSRPELVALLSG